MKFVIHKHYADKAGIHYDLRMVDPNNKNNVLSFVSKKELPHSYGIKRLLIKQKNHKLPILNFEGEIKSGYGKGKMIIIDSGDYEVLHESKNKKSQSLFFKGKILNGKYNLVRLDKENEFIFYKVKNGG